MKVELIYDHDCPNVELAREHVRSALAQVGHRERWLEWERSDKRSPGYVRKYGSPTILVNERDVAEDPEMSGNACCRVYEHGNGGLSGVPTVEMITSALNLAEGAEL